MRASFLATLVCALAATAAASCSSDKKPPLGPDAGGPDAGGAVTGPLGSRPDLPVDGRLIIANLHAPVDVVRDVYGRPHIYATNLEDAMRVEGWLVAKDRMLQLEFFRRVSEGRLAELLADLDPSTIDTDIVFRTIGLARIAKAQYDALPAGETKAALDAYADGITQLFRMIRSSEVLTPNVLIGFPKEAFTDWSAIDSLAVARLQAYLLSFTGDSDLRVQVFFNGAGWIFSAASSDPALKKRAG